MAPTGLAPCRTYPYYRLRQSEGCWQKRSLVPENPDAERIGRPSADSESGLREEHDSTNRHGVGFQVSEQDNSCRLYPCRNEQGGQEAYGEKRGAESWKRNIERCSPYAGLAKDLGAIAVSRSRLRCRDPRRRRIALPNDRKGNAYKTMPSASPATDRGIGLRVRIVRRTWEHALRAGASAWQGRWATRDARRSGWHESG